MVKTMTVRLPQALYETARSVARRREMSLNALVREGLEAISKKDNEARLYESFGLLGEDARMCDVEFAFNAQREVVARGERVEKARRRPRSR